MRPTNRTWVTLGTDFGAMGVIAMLTPMAVRRLLLLDDLWEASWNKINPPKPTATQLELPFPPDWASAEAL